MEILDIDYGTGIVTYWCGDLVCPVQEDWDAIPDLKVGMVI